MKPKERVILALQHREPDRVPVGEMAIDFPITEAVLGHPTLYRSKWKEYVAEWNGQRDEIARSYGRDIVDLVRYFDLDYLAVPLVPPRRERYEPPEFLDEYTWRDSVGRVWQYSPQSEGHKMCIQGIEMSSDDLPSHLGVDESRLEAVQYVVRELGGTHFILGRIPDGSWPWEVTLGSMDSFLLKMLDDPAFVQRAVDVCTEESIAYAEAMIDLGCDAVSGDIDYCGNQGPIMGPALFHKFCFPSLKKQVAAVHAKGGLVVKHSDGNNWPILDDFVSAGIDGWQGIQPRIGMDMRLLKERYGDSLCFFGGVDVDTLIDGSTEDVVEQVRYAIRYAGRGGGLVMTSGNTLYPGVRLDNYIAMLKATRDLGSYPISI